MFHINPSFHYQLEIQAQPNGNKPNGLLLYFCLSTFKEMSIDLSLPQLGKSKKTQPHQSVSSFSLFSFGVVFIFFATKNIQADIRAKRIPEDKETTKGRTFPLINTSTGYNHLIA